MDQHAVARELYLTTFNCGAAGLPPHCLQPPSRRKSPLRGSGPGLTPRTPLPTRPLASVYTPHRGDRNADMVHDSREARVPPPEFNSSLPNFSRCVALD